MFPLSIWLYDNIDTPIYQDGIMHKDKPIDFVYFVYCPIDENSDIIPYTII